MKIAAITDDGITISQHFGRAQYYAVLTIEDGAVVVAETRPKLGHAAFREVGHAGPQMAAHQHEQESTEKEGRHGYGDGAAHRHAAMAEAILDCDILLCRGMGYGAYEAMAQSGIKPVVTDIPLIEEAVKAYLAGDLVDHTELLH